MKVPAKVLPTLRSFEIFGLLRGMDDMNNGSVVRKNKLFDGHVGFDSRANVLLYISLPQRAAQDVAVDVLVEVVEVGGRRKATSLQEA